MVERGLPPLRRTDLQLHGHLRELSQATSSTMSDERTRRQWAISHEPKKGGHMAIQGPPTQGMVTVVEVPWMPGTEAAGRVPPRECIRAARDAAVRECEEETGLFVRPLTEDGYTVNVSPSGFTIATLFVRCEYLGGEPTNREPDKAMAVRWMPREMLVELDLFAPLDSWWKRPMSASRLDEERKP